MSEPLRLPPEDEALLAWVAQNAATVRRAFRLLNTLLALETRLVSQPSAVGMATKLIVEDTAALLALPLKFRGALADVPAYTDTAGAAYSQTKMQDAMDQIEALGLQLNDLLEELRQNGQNG